MPKVMIVLLAAAVLGAGIWMLTSSEPESALDVAESSPKPGAGVDDPGAALVGTRDGSLPPLASATGKHSIVGTVVDADGGPVGDLVVVVRFGGAWPGGTSYADMTRFYGDAVVRRVQRLADGPPDPETVRVQCDAEGRFTFRTDRAGSYTLQPLVDAPRIGTISSVTIFPQAAQQKTVLKVLPGAPLSGRVVTAAGEPVTGRIEAEWSERGVGKWSDSAESAADGAFQYPAAPHGRVAFTVFVEGRAYERVASVDTPATDPLVITLPGGGTRLAGSVAGVDGTPVPGAAVLIQLELPGASGSDEGGKSTLRLGAVSDDAGKVHFEGIPAGHMIQLRAMAEGYRPLRLYRGDAWAGLEVIADKTVPFDVTLQRGATVTGRVLVQGTQDGIEGAHVTLYYKDWHPPKRQDTTTGPDGRFTFAAIGKGSYFLLAGHPTHYSPEVATALSPGAVAGGRGSPPATLALTVPDADETVSRDLELAPGARISGRVVGPDGAGVSGAQVHARMYSMQHLAQRWGVGRFGDEADIVLGMSGADGAFTLQGMPPRSEWVLFARRAGFAGQYADPVQSKAGEETTGIVLRLAGGCTIRGRVIDVDGSPRRGQPVFVSGRIELRGADMTAATDDDGVFEVSSMPAEPLTLSAFLPGGETARVKVDGLKAGDVREGVDIVFEAGVEVTGVVTDKAGQPVPRLSLAGSYKDARAPHTVWTSTDTKGRFRFKGIPPGQLVISAADGRERVGLSDVIDAPSSGHTLVYEPVKRVTITGTVVGPDGEVIPACRVIARTMDGKQAFAGRTGRVENGKFKIEIAGTPPFWITASNPAGRDGKPMNLRFASMSVDDPSQPVTIQLKAGYGLAGRVVDAEDKPVGDVRIRVGGASTKSAADGTWTLAGLAEGDQMVNAYPPAPYMQPKGVAAKAGDTDVIVRVSAGVIISGRVVVPEGVKLTGASVAGFWRAEGVGPGSGRVRGRVTPTGAFTLAGIPPSAVVDIRVMPFGRQDAKVHLAPATVKDVAAGARDVEVRLEAGISISGVIVERDGSPIRGGRVSVRRVGPVFGTGSASCDVKGAFTIHGLAPGRYHLVVQDPSGIRKQLADVRAPGEGLRIEVPGMHTITGRITGDRGSVGWIVTGLDAETMSWLPGGQKVVAPDGTWKLENVPDDRKWVVRATPREPSPLYAVSGVIEAGAEGVELEVRTGLTIQGRVIRDGEPATGCHVTAKSATWTSGAPCDKDGRFVLQGLPEGRYTLTAGYYNSADKAVREGVATGTSDAVLEFK